ncbi:MAG: hypothetical protein EZS28_005609 [Streblomastix strix]|uniref:OTU domain-containing protein n=1 Tax=Streblomastix strix TaxID=222440 RepID=A0A5J4WUY8_9EUKA|nr:MAG: hypothetical protein EZS28_005609 [Streblomastix strix]
MWKQYTWTVPQCTNSTALIVTTCIKQFNQYIEYLGKRLPTKRSIRATRSQRIGASIFWLVIACLLANPGHPTLAARDYGLPIRTVYDICKLWCRQTNYVVDHIKLPSYVTPERVAKVADQIYQDIHESRYVTEDDISERFLNARRQELSVALVRSQQLRLTGLIKQFRLKAVPPSIEYVRLFARNHNIMFNTNQGIDPNRLSAQCASNIHNWFATIYTPDFLVGVRERGIFNMDEISLSFEGKDRVAKERGTRRGPQKPIAKLGKHLTFCPTISAGVRYLPPLIILSNLTRVPKNLVQFIESNQITISISNSGFINEEIFFTWIQNFANWIQELRNQNYLNAQEPVLLLLDGHYSRNHPGVQDILERANIRAITLPGALTQIIQPLDVAVFRSFRACYKKLMRQRLNEFKKTLHLRDIIKINESLKRELSIQCAIDSFQQCSTQQTRSNGFRITGIYPRDEQMPIHQEQIRQDYSNPEFPEGRHPSNQQASCKVIAGPQKRKRNNSEVETEFDKQVEIKRQIPDKKSSIIKKEIRERILKRVRYDYEQQLPVIIVPIQVIDLKSRLYMRNIQVQTQNSVPDEIEIMRQEVQLIGGTIRNNRGMGNCLFFAIADQLHRLGVTAATVRRDACQYLLDHMQENIELFDETESIENYGKRMQQNGEYGDGRIFRAICNLYHVRIRIRMINNVTFEQGDDHDPIIEIGYVSRMHYVSIRFD